MEEEEECRRSAVLLKRSALSEVALLEDGYWRAGAITVAYSQGAKSDLVSARGNGQLDVAFPNGSPERNGCSGPGHDELL